MAGVGHSTGSSSTASSKSRLLDDSGGEPTVAGVGVGVGSGVGGGGGAGEGVSGGGLIEFTSSTSARYNKQGNAVGAVSSRLSDGKPEDMMLLEKQGRSSQRQRMQEGEPRRAGSLPPSSLPRPPRALKSSGNSRYCRLSDTETRKKSDPGPGVIDTIKTTRDSGNCTLEYGRFDSGKGMRRKKSVADAFVPNTLKKPSSGEYERLGEVERKKMILSSGDVKHRETQGRSLIPPPSRRIGDYGRLSDGDAKATLRKQTGGSSVRGLSTGSMVSSKSGGRDSGGTASSDASTSSLPPTKVRSIPRPSNYRIQF